MLSSLEVRCTGGPSRQRGPHSLRAQRKFPNPPLSNPAEIWPRLYEIREGFARRLTFTCFNRNFQCFGCCHNNDCDDHAATSCKYLDISLSLYLHIVTLFGHTCLTISTSLCASFGCFLNLISEFRFRITKYINTPNMTLWENSLDILSLRYNLYHYCNRQ